MFFSQPRRLPVNVIDLEAAPQGLLPPRICSRVGAVLHIASKRFCTKRGHEHGYQE